MDSNYKQLCRVCLNKSDDSINIFDQFQDSTIASILVEHFWFQVRKNDGMTEWLCKICWINIKTFHIFYNRIEFLHAKYYSTTDLDIGDLKTNEQIVSPKEEALEFNLNIVKCEETKLTEVVGIHISGKNSSDCDDNNDDKNYYDESKNSQTLDDEDQSSNEKPKNDALEDINAGKEIPIADIKPKSYNTHSRSELDKQNAKIREFFSMKCEICSNFEFETLRIARQHYRQVHNTDGYIVCCGKKYHRRHAILNHIIRHVNPDAYRCDQCGKCFSRKYTLREHIKNHVTLDFRPHKCGLCSKSFAQAGSLKAHVEIKHSSKTDGEIFPCEKCNKRFTSKWSAIYHIRNVHESTLRHVCEVCALQFKTKISLQKHVTIQHRTTPLTKVQCKICGAWLKHESSLGSHMKLHDRYEDDLVNCPICNKVVRNKYRLPGHIRQVHGERNHRCTLCDKAFKTATNLKEHLASHTGEDLYDCIFCEKKFKSNANMYSHRKKAHLEEWTQHSKKKRMEEK